MKALTLILSLVFFAATASAPSVYDFKLKPLTGKRFSLAKYKGKKVLVVNTASKCGFTKQYTDLQKLSETYKDKLVVVGSRLTILAARSLEQTRISKLFATIIFR